MHIRSLAGKNVCILGYGREGRAMAAALEKHAKGCRITIADHNGELRIENRELQRQLGEQWLNHLDRFDVIIKSPGVPPYAFFQFSILNSQFTSPTQIFFDSIVGSSALVIGVTGSKGKSTTATLLYKILQTRNKEPGTRNFLIGNIGDPAIAHLEDAQSSTIFIQELSSYQLMDLTSSPQIAVITAFFPEHLDYHRSLENYLEAKKNITRFQTKDDVVFFNEQSKEATEIAREGKGKKIPVRIADAPLALRQTRLQGKHNLMNIALAWRVTEHLGVPKEAAIAAIASFTPLPHRLESLGIHDGIEWVNDSISTTPQSAIAALDALGDRVITIILGGQDRGYNFEPLVQRIKRSNVKTVILIPDSGATIRRTLEEAHATLELIDVETMVEAILAAKRSAKNSQFSILNSQFPIVLLSPAAPSYGHFKNFEDRGDQFKKAIFNPQTSKPVNQ